MPSLYSLSELFREILESRASAIKAGGQLTGGGCWALKEMCLTMQRYSMQFQPHRTLSVKKIVWVFIVFPTMYVPIRAAVQ